MVICVFGRRGSGKTTLIKGNLRSYKRPVLIVDVLGNFDDDRIIQVKSIPDCIQRLRECKRTKADTVISIRTSDPALAADYLSAAIWEMEGGTLVLDEVDSIRYKDGSCFDEYIRYGRNHGGDLITGCRRPAELDKNITAAANKFYCFSTHEVRDIEYFEASVFGERAWELQTLPPYHGMFLDYDRKVIGKFKIDILGQVFHTDESALT